MKWYSYLHLLLLLYIFPFLFLFSSFDFTDISCLCLDSTKGIHVLINSSKTFGRVVFLAWLKIISKISKYSFCHFHSRKRNLETSIALDRKQSNILKPASYHLRMHGYCIYSESHKMFTNVYIVFQTIRYSFVFLLNRCYFISLYSLLYSTRFSTY